MAIFETLNSLTLISRKIWVGENLLNFLTVLLKDQCLLFKEMKSCCTVWFRIYGQNNCTIGFSSVPILWTGLQKNAVTLPMGLPLKLVLEIPNWQLVHPQLNHIEVPIRNFQKKMVFPETKNSDNFDDFSIDAKYFPNNHSLTCCCCGSSRLDDVLKNSLVKQNFL